MRICDDRYSRDRLRFDLALRFIQHEARTRTIRQWTGLTDDRIRKLYRNYLSQPGAAGVIRHRGKSPQLAAFFTRNPRMREETAILASVCYLLGVMPGSRLADAQRSLPGVQRSVVRLVSWVVSITTPRGVDGAWASDQRVAAFTRATRAM